MDLVEVDVVGVQAPQRVLDGLHDPAARAALVVDLVAHLAVELRGEDDVVAAAFEGLADDLLVLALRIDVGRVDEVDARVERGVDDPDRLVVVGLTPGAEHHRAEAQGADLYAGAAERAELHAARLLRAASRPARRSSSSRSKPSIGTSPGSGTTRTSASARDSAAACQLDSTVARASVSSGAGGPPAPPSGRRPIASTATIGPSAPAAMTSTGKLSSTPPSTSSRSPATTGGTRPGSDMLAPTASQSGPERWTTGSAATRSALTQK